MPRFVDTYRDMIGGTLVQYEHAGQQNEIGRGTVVSVRVSGENEVEIKTDTSVQYLDRNYLSAKTEERDGVTCINCPHLQMYFAIAPAGVEIPRATGKRRLRETLNPGDLSPIPQD